MDVTWKNLLEAALQEPENKVAKLVIEYFKQDVCDIYEDLKFNQADEQQ